MAVLAPSHPNSTGRSEQPAGAAKKRFARDRPGYQRDAGMSDSGMTKAEQIRERLERDDYQVDARKVADAIVDRLLAGRSAKEAVVTTR
jgi:anti-sigma28 factor (negative regulator of flagellin synthesis)